MKMLTGLLPPTEGDGDAVRPAGRGRRAWRSRQHVGYMSQAFSLYGELTVRQNLVLHARCFTCRPTKAKARIEELVERFGLDAHVDALAEALPLGHPPAPVAGGGGDPRAEMLILDEPTSGVDPVARDSFWELLDRPLAQAGRHDLRLHPLHERGRALRPHLADARRAGAGLRRARQARRGARRGDPRGRLHRLPGGGDRPSRGARRRSDRRRGAGRRRAAAGGRGRAPTRRVRAWRSASAGCSPTRARDAWRSCATRSGWRFAFLGSALLMLVFGFGITIDVEDLRFAALDRDQTPESRDYLEQFAGSPLLRRARPLPLADEALERLQAGESRSRSRSRPASGATSRAARRRRCGAGSTAPCRSAARPSAATCRACTATYLADLARRTARRACRASTGRHRGALPLQPDFREPRRDGARASRRCCCCSSPRS